MPAHERTNEHERTNGHPHPTRPIIVGDLEIDLAASRARLAGRTLPLRAREFELLAYLAKRRGQFVPRRDILRDVWADYVGAKQNSLHVHLATLRTKLGERARRPRLVTTRRHLGIKLDEPLAPGAGQAPV